MIHLDFACITESDTQGKGVILPSVPTCVNSHVRMWEKEDIDELLNEIQGPDLYERIIEAHHMIRTRESERSLISSNVRILEIACLWAYISPF